MLRRTQQPSSLLARLPVRFLLPLRHPAAIAAAATSASARVLSAATAAAARAGAARQPLPSRSLLTNFRSRAVQPCVLAPIAQPTLLLGLVQPTLSLTAACSSCCKACLAPSFLRAHPRVLPLCPFPPMTLCQLCSSSTSCPFTGCSRTHHPAPAMLHPRRVITSANCT